MKVKGRQVRRSLDTQDRPLAKRRLADLQRDFLRVDSGAGHLSLADLRDRFPATTAHQSTSTVEYHHLAGELPVCPTQPAQGVPRQPARSLMRISGSISSKLLVGVEREAEFKGAMGGLEITFKGSHDWTPKTAGPGARRSCACW